MREAFRLRGVFSDRITTTVSEEGLVGSGLTSGRRPSVKDDCFIRLGLVSDGDGVKALGFTTEFDEIDGLVLTATTDEVEE